MRWSMLASRSLAVAALLLAAPQWAAADAHDLARCLEEKPLPRVARVRTAAGEIRWARVLESASGVPARVALLARNIDVARAVAAASEPAPSGTQTVAIAPEHA